MRCLLVLTAVMITGWAAGESPPEEAAAALAAAIAHEEAAAGARSALFYQSVVLENGFQMDLEFGWDGHRIFSIERPHDGQRHQIWDGRRHQLFTAFPDRQDLFVSSDRHNAIHGWAEVHLSKLFPLTLHWWRGEHASPVDPKWGYVSTEVRRGLTCHVFARITTNYAHRPVLERSWIDAEERLARIEQYLGTFGGDVSVEEALEKGRLHRAAEYLEYRVHEGVPVAHRIEEEGSTNWLGRVIRTERVQFNGNLDPRLFALEVPEGVKVVDVSGEFLVSYRYPRGQYTTEEWEAILAEAQAVSRERQQDRETRNDMLGKPAPALEVARWVHSDEGAYKNSAGKWVVIEFFSIACGPCMSAIPALNEAMEEFTRDEVIVFAVHTAINPQADPEIRAYMEEHGIRYPVAISEGGLEHGWGKVYHEYRIKGIPQSVLLDPQGRIAEYGQIWPLMVSLRKRLYPEE